ELGRQGVKVIAVGVETTCVRYSRYCQWVQLPQEGPEGDQLLQFLLGAESESLRGGVLLACSDAALLVLAKHRRALQQRYRLDLANPSAQLSMLYKLSTYEIARAAGVVTPRFWNITSNADVESIRNELVFPLMIKPRLSHVFERRFGKKHMIATGIDELLTMLSVAIDAGIGVL